MSGHIQPIGNLDSCMPPNLAANTIRLYQFPKIEIRQLLHGGSGGVSPRNIARPNKEVKIMPLIQLLEILIVVGVLLWLVNRFIPMQSSIKSILNGVVIIAVVLWLLNVFGLFHSLSRIHVGTLLIP
jgi:hypothetical protein